MSAAGDRADDAPLEVVRHALRERVKELRCLYDVSALLADGARPLSARLQAVVDRLPAGWQHPERAVARLVVDDESYASAGWAQPPDALRADVRVAGEAVGRLEVAYLAGASPDAGFLDEERLLLDEVAVRLGVFLEHEWGRERAREPEEVPAARPDTADESAGFHGLVGTSEPMQRVRRAIEKAARSDATILVHGESGTGKELVARAIHYRSARSTEPFVPVNCAAIPESLVESELFGYVKGAFTGATHARAGFFQTAHGGTIFLDEIGETSPAVQAKLLRVLESGEVRMVGSDRTARADVRVVAATNKDLAALVSAERFRADLYFRLNVLSLELPALRERREDLEALLAHFDAKRAADAGARRLTLSPRALRALRGYDWPGNVRELENLVHRLAVMVDGDVVDVGDLPDPMRFSPPRSGPDLRSLAEVEREHVRRVLRAVDGNRSEAARVLGIDRKTLRRKLGPAERPPGSEG